ncbi:hypothetical protein IC229_22670 [Spirosoma sp. BT702]|uniref:Secretion system C-terminal sorting domain-containing protein n=1 Tax=Spirosoma profusum TaxID=2771354 RepID=A0A927AS88_9BACT|nr:hypothetical protein [Spirosoma profusum]MBD2703466.1 hypothetical protein [Spirosoma profusum]
MKSLAHKLRNGLIMSLIWVSVVANAQSVNTETEAPVEKQPFEVGTYMGTGLTINVMLAVHTPKGVTLKIKDANDTVLEVTHLRRAPKAYHQKISFEGSQPGVYRVEISDGRKTIVRQIDVVDIPAVESQRYITYSSQTNQ